jgi:hypothetical protein
MKFSLLKIGILGEKFEAIGVYTILKLVSSLFIEERQIFSLSLWLYTPFGHWPLFQFLNLHTVDRTPLDGRLARCKAATYIQNNTNSE